jgi:hypothetical protein
MERTLEAGPDGTAEVAGESAAEERGATEAGVPTKGVDGASAAS